MSKRNDAAKTKMTEVYLYATTAFGLPNLCPTRFELPSSRLGVFRGIKLTAQLMSPVANNPLVCTIHQFAKVFRYFRDLQGISTDFYRPLVGISGIVGVFLGFLGD